VRACVRDCVGVCALAIACACVRARVRDGSLSEKSGATPKGNPRPSRLGEDYAGAWLGADACVLLVEFACTLKGGVKVIVSAGGDKAGGVAKNNGDAEHTAYFL